MNLNAIYTVGKVGICRMNKLSNGLHALFCVCFALATLSILSLSGCALALTTAAFGLDCLRDHKREETGNA